MRTRTQKLLPFALIAAGAALIFFGARDYLASRVGQSEAAREFRASEDYVIESPEPGPKPAPPVRIGDTIAKLTIPRLDTELYVVEGDQASQLRRAPGHLAGSAMPGQDGNCIIAGHRDTHFRILKDIRPGDDIVLETPAGQFLYRVKRLRVVSETNTGPLQPTPDAQLNLITCYPFYYIGSAPNRFIVEAKLAGAVQRTS